MKYLMKFNESKEVDSIRGVDIYLDRLNSFLETIGKPTIESIYGYNMI